MLRAEQDGSLEVRVVAVRDDVAGVQLERLAAADAVGSDVLALVPSRSECLLAEASLSLARS
jgi:hypothetical protein